MHRFIRLISLVLVCCTVMYLPLPVDGAYPRTVTLSGAVSTALNTSYAIQKVKNDIVLKKIELKQAIDGIRDTRKKESTIKFSLLFNIEFPTGHALPKEIELVMKVPGIQSGIKDLERKLENERLKTIYATENAFLNVLELDETCRSLEKQIADEKKTYLRLGKDLILGIADKTDVDSVKKSVEKLGKEYQSNLTRYEAAKKKLSQAMGVDVNQGFSFIADFSQLKLERSQLSQVTDFALSKDYNVYKAELTRKLAQTKVQTLRGIYNSRWGSAVSIIEADLARNGTIDYNSFLNKYNTALNNIENPYSGYFSIPLLFIVIKIPKEWFRSEYSGIRYFEDQKYALFISLMEKDGAVKEEEAARTTLKTSVEDSFNTLLELWSAYEQSILDKEKAKIDYERIKKLNMEGRASFMEVESARKDVMSIETSSFSALVSYNKMLSSFDLTTCGAITNLKSGVALDKGEYASGNSFLTDPDSVNTPKWYLTTLIEDFKFTFGVSIPEESGIKATHFELYTEDGSRIGDKTTIDKEISHLPLTFQDSTKLTVKLYDSKKLAYICEVDAAEYQGNLEPEPVAASDSQTGIASGTIVGNWKLTADSLLTSALEIAFMKEYNIKYYQVETIDGTVVGGQKIPSGSRLVHLTVTFSSFDKLKVTVFDEKEQPIGEVLLNTGGVQSVVLK